MNFTAAAHWICQNPGSDAVIVLFAVTAALIGPRIYREYKADQESYARSEKIVNDYMNRPRLRPKLPPHSPRK